MKLSIANIKPIISMVFILLTACVHKGNQPKFQIQRLDMGVYMHTSYQLYGDSWVDSNGLVVVNDSRAIIVDTPWSEYDTHELLSWIDAQGYSLQASISTHFHADRTAGIGLLNSMSIPTHSSKLTHHFLMKENKPTASHVFTGDYFSMMDGLIEVYYPGPGHTRDNLVVWLPEKSILFGGCLVRSLEWSTLGFTGDAMISQWADSISRIQSKYSSIDVVVPGHGEVAGRSILDHTHELAIKAAERL